MQATAYSLRSYVAPAPAAPDAQRWAYEGSPLKIGAKMGSDTKKLSQDETKPR
jgi:hypothetical protein